MALSLWKDKHTIPTDTWRNNNALVTSKRRRNALWRNNDFIITPCGRWAKNKESNSSQVAKTLESIEPLFSVPLCCGDTCQIWTWYHPGDIMQVTVGLIFLKNWENNGTEENGSVDSRVFVTCELLDWKYLSYSFANSRFPVSEKLTNGALVTPIQEPPIHWRIYAAPGGWVNPSPPNAAYMRQWIGSAGSDNGLSPLSKPTMGHCQLGPWEQTSVKL